jgi:hypothetical protein
VTLVLNKKEMTAIDQIVSDINKNTDSLLKQLLDFSAENFSVKPAANEWSAAEVGEHILLIDGIVMKALRGSALPTTQREYDYKLTVLKPALANTEMKFPSPDLAKPISTHFNRQVLVDELAHLRQEQASLLPGMDLTESCMDLKHPLMGTMTRYEWIYFNIYHTERHLHQLIRIAEAVGN